MSISTFIELANGVKMPRIGLGTYLLQGNSGEKTILQAIKLGYRLFDTASMYGNESELGTALKKSGISRDEFFITSKVWNSEQGYDSTIQAFRASLKRLDLNYLDLYLIHWPVPDKREATWKALENIYQKGECRVIGVSNYYIRHLKPLILSDSINPMVNQVEFNPFLYLKDLLSYCKENSVVLESYAPLTHGHKLKHPILQKMAKELNLSPAQIILRWSLQHGTVVIPKASSKDHLAQNIKIFDFELNDKHMEHLNQLDMNYHSDWNPQSIG